MPLALLDSGFAAESQVVFYASTPGAFVDLAADLTYAFAQPPRTPGRDGGSSGTALDPAGRGPASPDGDTFSLSGVAELSTIDRAVGVLIDQGHHPDDAHATLRRDAARAGLEPHVLGRAVVAADARSPARIGVRLVCCIG